MSDLIAVCFALSIVEPAARFATVDLQNAIVFCRAYEN